MRVRKQKATIRNSHAPQMASYHQGPILTNGALEFIYEKPVCWPLYTYWGRGLRNIEQWHTLQQPQLRTVHAVTVQPIYGPGVPAGYIQHQGLTPDQQLAKMLAEAGA